MELLLTYTSGLVMAAVSILVHYELLYRLSRLLRGSSLPPRGKISTLMFGIFVSHTLVIAIYACAYYVLMGTGLGHFSPAFGGTPSDYFSFSAVSYSTLGIGPVQPLGGFAVVSAMQGLTGFSLITWSATFGYTAMQELWQGRKLPDGEH